MHRPRKTFEELRREARATKPFRLSRRELAQIALLKGAHQETIVPLLQACPIKVLASNEVLHRAGDACTALYLVLSGRLRMQGPSGSVPETSVPAGDCIGELFLLQRAVVAATVSAAEPTRLLVIDRRTAWALIGTSHEIARNWLSLLSERAHVSAVIDGSTVLQTEHERYTTHDERTGLNNRRWLESILPRQMARSIESKEPLALLLVEIDSYADYVAAYGPAAGGQACRLVAETLVKNVRPTDLLACCGTALFALVLPASNAANACLVGERIRHAISRAPELALEESAVAPFTVSVGASELKPHTDASALLAAAEAALRTAKAAGGDRVGMQA